MGHDIRAGHLHGIPRLEPDRAGDATIVPPVSEAPRHDVVPRPPGRVVDPHRDQVLFARMQGLRRVERERRVAALVIAKVRSVDPHVRDVVHGAELERHGQAVPRGGHHERVPIPRPGLSVGRRVHRPRHGRRLPAGVVVSGAVPPGGLGGDPVERLPAVGQRQLGVEDGALNPPRPGEVQVWTRLRFEGRHGDAVLHRHATAAHIIHGEGGGQRATTGRRRAGDEQRRRQKPCHGQGRRSAARASGSHFSITPSSSITP